MEAYVFSDAPVLLGIADDPLSCETVLRYQSAGSIEAEFRNSEYNRTLLIPGRVLAIRQDRGLTGADAEPFRGKYDGFWLESVEIDTKGRLRVTGSGLETLLDRRVIPTGRTQEGDSTELIGGLIGEFFTRPQDANRTVPQLAAAEVTAEGVAVKREGGRESVYDAVQALSELGEQGFAVELDAARSRFTFRQYIGADRTETGPIPVLSATLGNLDEESCREDWTEYRTTVYMDAGELGVVVVGGEETGLDRRERLASAEGETAAEVRAHGLDVLAQSVIEKRIDATVREGSDCVFRRDYGLGDIFTVRSERFGVQTQYGISAVRERWSNGRYTVSPVLGSEMNRKLRRLSKLLTARD